MTPLRILFLSDLHAFAAPRKEGDPSYINAAVANKHATQDCFEALKALVVKEKIRVDLVICGGDLGDQADAGGIAHAWRELHLIGGLVDAESTVAVCGNHDLDSRYLVNLKDPDPKGFLQELMPGFPLSDEVLNDRFWSRNFVTVETGRGGARLLLVNSSAFHGGKDEEIKHGRIAGRTVDRIRRTLETEGRRELNILVCHHHPFPHAQLDGTADYQSMQNGQALLDCLAAVDLGPWLVLHGHRHQPRVGLAPSSIASPLIIGAASFSRRVNEVANQVHLIEVESCDSLEYDIRGRVTSWTFAFGKGFQFAPGANNALPPSCGFGYRGNTNALLASILKSVKEGSEAYVTWAEVERQFPQVRYLMPDAFDVLVRKLGDSGVEVLSDRHGYPTQVLISKS